MPLQNLTFFENKSHGNNVSQDETSSVVISPTQSKYDKYHKEELEEIFRSHQNTSEIVSSLNEICEWVDCEEEKWIHLFSNGLAKILLFFIQNFENSELQVNAVYIIGWSSENGNEAIVEALLKENAPDVLLPLLNSAEEGIQEQVAFALGNCSMNDKWRDICLRNPNYLPSLIKLLTFTNLNVLKQVLWALGNILREESCREKLYECKAHLQLLNLLEANDADVKAHTLWVFSFCVPDSQLRDELGNILLDKFLQLLSLNSSDIQKQAIICIGNICQDEQNQKMFFEKNGIQKLLPFLSIENDELLKEAVTTLGKCTFFLKESKEQFSSLGGLKTLISLLDTSNIELLECVSLTLSSITTGADIKIGLDIVRYQGILRLRNLLFSSNLNIVINSVSILANILLHNPIIQREFQTSGGISDLIRLLHSTNTQLLAEVCRCLSTLATQSDNRTQIRDLGALSLLVPLLTSTEEVLLKQTLIVLINSAANNLESKIEIRKHGGVGFLVSLFSLKSVEIQVLAMGCLANLSPDDGSASLAYDTGGIHQLIELLKDDNEEIQAMSARTISWLCHSDFRNQETIRREKGIDTLIQLLSSENENIQAHAARCIGVLAQNEENKRYISIRGCFCKLKLLEESDNKVVATHATFALTILTEGNGLEMGEIEILPTFNFSATHTETCSICLIEIQADEIVRILPCLHLFHVQCIDMWLGNSPLCPMCKYDLQADIGRRGRRNPNENDNEEEEQSDSEEEE